MSSDHRTLRELRDIARNMRIRGFYKLNKAPLIRAIHNAVKNPGVVHVVHNNVANTFNTYYVQAPAGERDPWVFLEKQKQGIIDNAAPLTKLWLALEIQFVKSQNSDYKDAVLASLPQTIINTDNDLNVDIMFERIMSLIDRYTNEGSGFTINKINRLFVNKIRVDLTGAGSYFEAPTFIKNKKAIVNIKNNDEKCLIHCLNAALHPVKKNKERVASYPADHGLNFTGIDFPTPYTQVKKVEKLNNLAINVYYLEGGTKVQPCHLSKQPKHMKRIHLLMIEDEETDRQHYTWIKHFNRLLFDTRKCKNQTYFCDRCLNGFTSERVLLQHREDCEGTETHNARIIMPPREKSKVKFVNYHKQLQVPYIVVADCESLIKEHKENRGDRTEIKSRHELCSYAFKLLRYDGDSSKLKLYRGLDAGKKFIDDLMKVEKYVFRQLSNPVPMKMTPEERRAFKGASMCHICENQLGGDRVRDHCHITGKYRGPAHNACNLALRIDPKTMHIPVIFHNLRGYDSHLILQDLAQADGRLTCIPNNMEKYISFSAGRLRFVDSLQFMSSSLDRLVKSTKKEDLKITRAHFKTDEQFNLMAQKGVYPYEYMNDWCKFNKRKPPKKSKFYSSLENKHITDEQYEHVHTVWRTMGCRNLGDYHDLYLTTDVLLLCDIFQNFREVCVKTYKLDPAHYYTSPGLAWDALLKKTRTELELLTDIDMFLMVEKGLRGGISMVSKRHVVANNKHVDGYDPNKPSNYLMYLDANNLYGWAMMQKLPTGQFEWKNDLTAETILSHPPDDPRGYIVEVDLEYPPELHDEHNEYPLAPERLKVEEDWLSDYQKKHRINTVETFKLIPNLRNKTKYVVHYRTLQLYVSLGLKVVKLHRVLEFHQSSWMAPYIEMNTNMRKKAQSDFEKDFFKLMNNSVFGKTMENLRRRVSIKLLRVTEERQIQKLVSKPSYIRHEIYNDKLVAIQNRKNQIVMNKPIYVGMSVLDLSKRLMYDLYYNDYKKKYGNKCKLCYTDTDSFVLEVFTDDFYAEMDPKKYDNSDFPKDHPLYSEENKRVVGLMKDECASEPIAEFIALRPKMYSVLKKSGANIKKAKGVKSYIVKGTINHEMYKECITDSKTFTHEMNMLSSKKHQIYGVTQTKQSLSPYDSKRYWLEDGISSYAYGHYRIANRV